MDSDLQGRRDQYQVSPNNKSLYINTEHKRQGCLVPPLKYVPPNVQTSYPTVSTPYKDGLRHSALAVPLSRTCLLKSVLFVSYTISRSSILTGLVQVEFGQWDSPYQININYIPRLPQLPKLNIAAKAAPIGQQPRTLKFEEHFKLRYIIVQLPNT